MWLTGACHVLLQLSSANQIVSARVAGGLSTWRQYNEERQAMMRAELERILAHPGLCENTFEIVSKCLGRE
jgi:aminopeptidase N